MRVATVRAATRQDEFWAVEVQDWQSDVKPGQLVEQVRGTVSVAIWEVVGELEDTLILAPTQPIVVDIRAEDGLDACIGGRASHLGLGDVVASVTKAFGFQPCAACEERRQKLNQLFPKIMKR